MRQDSPTPPEMEPNSIRGLLLRTTLCSLRFIIFLASVFPSPEGTARMLRFMVWRLGLPQVESNLGLEGSIRRLVFGLWIRGKKKVDWSLLVVPKYAFHGSYLETCTVHVTFPQKMQK